MLAHRGLTRSFAAFILEFVMSVRPYLLLDVDGVIALLDKPRHDHWGDWEQHDGFRVWLSNRLITALGDLPVDVVWCTSWEDTANGLLLSVLEWTPKPVIHQRRGAPGEWPKLAGVKQWLETVPMRPMVWLDDDSYLIYQARPWLAYMQIPSLLIRPDAITGLTPDHIEAISDWVAGLSGTAVDKQ